MSESESDPPRSPRSPTPTPPPRGDLDRDPTFDVVELPHMTAPQRKKSKRQDAEDEQDDRFIREIRQRDNRARDMQRQLTTYLARSADKPADTTERGAWGSWMVTQMSHIHDSLMQDFYLRSHELLNSYIERSRPLFEQQQQRPQVQQQQQVQQPAQVMQQQQQQRVNPFRRQVPQVPDMSQQQSFTSIQPAQQSTSSYYGSYGSFNMSGPWGNTPSSQPANVPGQAPIGFGGVGPNMGAGLDQLPAGPTITSIRPARTASAPAPTTTSDPIITWDTPHPTAGSSSVSAPGTPGVFNFSDYVREQNASIPKPTDQQQE